MRPPTPQNNQLLKYRIDVVSIVSVNSTAFVLMSKVVDLLLAMEIERFNQIEIMVFDVNLCTVK